MLFPENDFIGYMGYRNALIEDKIEQCISSAQSGEATVYIDCDDMTEEEISYMQQEVRRRLANQ